MNNILYLDCSSGISGDMFVASMLDLGADKEVMLKALNSLLVRGFEVKVSRVMKSGYDACDFWVVLDEKYENHDHDMQYLHGEKGGDHHKETVTHHDHECRGIVEIEDIIRGADMTPGAKKLAMKIFAILADAEAKAHDVPVEQVHFHEVGAVDSIADIVAAAVCFDNLGISKVIIPQISDGTGTIRCRHGLLPVPVPAVRNIDESHKLNLHIIDVEGELVTPTGAAIAVAIRTDLQLPESFRVLRTGLGAGKREYKCSGILKAAFIKEEL
jgi:uncharacterized protein (TIGR00299 family) protein